VQYKTRRPEEIAWDDHRAVVIVVVEEVHDELLLDETPPQDDLGLGALGGGC
jgi:hypothetical protein